jgi:hypothetical protein
MPINRGPFNALVDDSGNGLTGSIWNKAAIQNVLLDPIDQSIGAPWLAFSPSWYGSGGIGPGLGNGTSAGIYVVIGKICFFEFTIWTGSTTSFGSGTMYQFNGPTVPYGPPLAGRQSANIQMHLMTGGGGGVPLITCIGGPLGFYGVTVTGALLGPTAPHTLDAGTAFFCRGTYPTT